MTKPIKPIGHRIAIHRDPEKDKIGSIYIPYYRVQPSNTGTVIAISEKIKKTYGDEIQVGMRVQFDPYLGTSYTHEGMELYIIDDDWVFGIIEPPPVEPAVL